MRREKMCIEKLFGDVGLVSGIRNAFQLKRTGRRFRTHYSAWTTEGNQLENTA
jgi:hypothetical protein